MRIRRPMFICILLLTIGTFTAIMPARTMAAARPYACNCTCAWVCDNRCQFNGDPGCTMTEAMDAAETCCNAAHQATGDTGPCGVGGPES